jgi:sigma-B regulation protein RsbU (phosphoserine phosphatase)
MFSRTGHVDLKVGVALGLVDTLPIWPETELDLDEHGARFLVFSDGITEQFNPAGEMYGTDRLLQAFRAALELDVDTMLQRIVEDVTTFRDDAPVKDDLTLIALELAE